MIFLKKKSNFVLHYSFLPSNAFLRVFNLIKNTFPWLINNLEMSHLSPSP